MEVGVNYNTINYRMMSIPEHIVGYVKSINLDTKVALLVITNKKLYDKFIKNINDCRLGLIMIATKNEETKYSSIQKIVKCNLMDKSVNCYENYIDDLVKENNKEEIILTYRDLFKDKLDFDIEKCFIKKIELNKIFDYKNEYRLRTTFISSNNWSTSINVMAEEGIKLCIEKILNFRLLGDNKILKSFKVNRVSLLPLTDIRDSISLDTDILICEVEKEVSDMYTSEFYVMSYKKLFNMPEDVNDSRVCFYSIKDFTDIRKKFIIIRYDGLYNNGMNIVDLVRKIIPNTVISILEHHNIKPIIKIVLNLNVIKISISYMNNKSELETNETYNFDDYVYENAILINDTKNE